ncbi:cupin domain-containing protein [Marinobacter sp. 1Y8]
MSTYHLGTAQDISIDRLKSLLPEQGCIELQQDRPNHTHDWHEHTIHETLIILQGHITFGIAEDEITCGPGEYVVLPAGTRHKSTSSEVGCAYIICFEDVRKALS